jgi:hypothetical protein
MYAAAVEATWHIRFAPGVFRSSGIIAYTTNVAIRKMEDVKLAATWKTRAL